MREQIAKARASLPPVVVVIEPRERERPEALEARIAKARERIGDRKSHVIIVDLDEGEATK
jgi:hypothetical protein